MYNGRVLKRGDSEIYRSLLSNVLSKKSLSKLDYIHIYRFRVM